MADHNLAGDFAACVMAPTDLGVIEGKYAVDDRPDLMLFHHPAQVLEIATAADHDRLERRLAQEHGHEVDAALCARENAHEGYLAAIRDCLDRSRQRIGTADLDHPIHATATRERAHLICPVRRGAIVDHLVCPQLAEP